MSERQNRLNARRVKLARAFAKRLKASAGTEIRRIVLYGSVARGEDPMGSDIDVLVEVRRRTPSLERRVYEAVAEMATDEGELIVPIVLSSDERRRYLPHYLQRTIRVEGKTLG